MINLYPYQEAAVNELVQKAVRRLSYSGKTIVFKAPTGSGKTIMMGELIRRLVTEYGVDHDVSFIWTCPRKLHIQSMNKLKEYIDDSSVLFLDANDLAEQIPKNSVLFLNWESLNKKDISTLMKENETGKNLPAILERTKHQLILIIDESHHTAGSSRSRELVELINPQLTIEVSATPDLNIGDELVTVDIDDVKNQGVIKEKILINPHFDKLVGNQSADIVVLKSALQKREELVQDYKRLKVDVNPLVLIQLPTEKEGLIAKDQEVEDILKKMGVPADKIAVWLSEKKTPNLPNIEKSNSDVEFLLFKEAIALGWDCPRAQILVVFRESKSVEFTIQTVGRIMRMPERKHYPTEEALNFGYIYTNLSEIKIETSLESAGYVTKNETLLKRNPGVYAAQLILTSSYRMKIHALYRLTSNFKKMFTDIANSTLKNWKPDFKMPDLQTIANAIINNIDIRQNVAGERVSLSESPEDLQYLFNKFLVEKAAPYSESSEVIRRAIYDFCETLQIRNKTNIQKAVFNDKDRFEAIIREAKELYTKSVKALPTSKIDEYDWSPPESININNPVSVTSTKYLMTPNVVKKDSNDEIEFVNFLENNSKCIDWWFKNGAKTRQYFGIQYQKGDETQMFYPDFIVKFRGSTVGIFDVKGRQTASDPDAKLKFEALYKYALKEGEKRNLKIISGAVYNADGVWLYNDGKNYSFDLHMLVKPNWNPLIEILDLF